VEQANLEQANLEQANLEQANLEQANLEQARASDFGSRCEDPLATAAGVGALPRPISKSG
jgi:uncharacterized protein YjbI with pentapeptide repeats